MGARPLGVRAARLAAVPNGTRVRLYGLARTGGTFLTSPVLERPCLAYRLVVERPGWHRLLERARCTDFLAQDGEVLVSVRGPFEVVLSVPYEWDFGDDVQRRLTRAVDAARLAGQSTERAGDEPSGGPRTGGEIFAADYRYFEALIVPGDRVSVEGFASVTVDPAGERAGLRQPPLLYTVAGTAERPAIISVPERGSVAP